MLNLSCLSTFCWLLFSEKRRKMNFWKVSTKLYVFILSNNTGRQPNPFHCPWSLLSVNTKGERSVWHSHTTRNNPSCFNILLLGNVYFPEPRIFCTCENVLFIGHYMKISFRFWELLLKMGWTSHGQISCKNNRFWSHQDPDVQLNSCHPLQ